MNANDITLTQVDTLGLLLAQIAELEKQAEAIKSELKDSATAASIKPQVLTITRSAPS
mgnify:CR=1 FL=1